MPIAGAGHVCFGMPFMSKTCATAASSLDSAAPATAFYRHVLHTLNDSGVPFMVGGAFAFACYTGIKRDTKDLDLFIRREDYARVEAALREAGYGTELTYPHWLAKVRSGEAFVDLIFSSGNGIVPVDDGWFAHASDADVMGVPVRITPPEESLWSKAFIMERERYDGADVAHLIHAYGARMDWHRLRARFGEHWRVLLSHLVLYGFIYPGERAVVPDWLMDELLEQLRHDRQPPPAQPKLCAGTLLSREQYLPDVEQQGYEDGRVEPFGAMTRQDVEHWTDAIPGRGDESRQ
jgi:predicted nucleotidyltransferase